MITSKNAGTQTDCFFLFQGFFLSVSLSLFFRRVGKQRSPLSFFIRGDELGFCFMSHWGCHIWHLDGSVLKAQLCAVSRRLLGVFQWVCSRVKPMNTRNSIFGGQISIANQLLHVAANVHERVINKILLKKHIEAITMSFPFVSEGSHPFSTWKSQAIFSIGFFWT